jgi:cellulose biosynthesis protein BcsQ
VLTYAYWNNKGGTGKTSLCFQSLTFYAEQHPDERILAIDVCPQANLSELLYGGLTNNGSEVLLARQGEPTRRTVGGYFESRLPSPYTAPAISAGLYISHPRDYNDVIPDNIDLIAGDPLLELQSNAMSTLANTVLPGTNAWLAIIDWLKDLLDEVRDEYDVVFIDANPSFSIYTQIALSCNPERVLPDLRTEVAVGHLRLLRIRDSAPSREAGPTESPRHRQESSYAVHGPRVGLFSCSSVNRQRCDRPDDRQPGNVHCDNPSRCG